MIGAGVTFTALAKHNVWKCAWLTQTQNILNLMLSHTFYSLKQTPQYLNLYVQKLAWSFIKCCIFFLFTELCKRKKKGWKS